MIQQFVPFASSGRESSTWYELRITAGLLAATGAVLVAGVYWSSSLLLLLTIALFLAAGLPLSRLVTRRRPVPFNRNGAGT